MGESSEIALTYAKIFLRELCPQNDFLDTARSDFKCGRRLKLRHLST